MKNNKTKKLSQAEILLNCLLKYQTITTIYCREKLSIMHPAARIETLRRKGWPIKTNVYSQIDSSGRAHRAAQYYLQVNKMTADQLLHMQSVLATI